MSEQERFERAELAYFNAINRLNEKSSRERELDGERAEATAEYSVQIEKLRVARKEGKMIAIPATSPKMHEIGIHLADATAERVEAAANIRELKNARDRAKYELDAVVISQFWDATVAPKVADLIIDLEAIVLMATTELGRPTVTDTHNTAVALRQLVLGHTPREKVEAAPVDIVELEFLRDFNSALLPTAFNAPPVPSGKRGQRWKFASMREASYAVTVRQDKKLVFKLVRPSDVSKLSAHAQAFLKIHNPSLFGRIVQTIGSLLTGDAAAEVEVG